MSFTVRAGAAAVLAIVMFAVAGCGETVIDTQKTQEQLQESLQKSLHEKIKDVSCPSNQKVEPGTTFTCQVDFSKGTKATVTLKIRNKEADVSIVGLKANKQKRGE
jgi:hypothetical protein